MTARRKAPRDGAGRHGVVHAPSDVIPSTDGPGRTRLATTRGRLSVGGRVGRIEGRRLTLEDAFSALRVTLADDGEAVALSTFDLVVVEGRLQAPTKSATHEVSLSDARVVNHARHAPRSERSGDAGANSDIARFGETGIGRNLRARAAALGVVRTYFGREGFLEVETPVRVRSPGLDAYVDAVAADGGFLITSPELHMKRLLVGGLPRVFQIARATRANEEGALHESEFTLVEWYRAFSGMESVVADTEALVSEVVLALSGTRRARLAGGRQVDVTPPFARLTVRDAFRKHAGIADAADLAATDEPRYFQTFVDHVEPALARKRRALLLCEFPVTQAALARPCPHDATVAERFEVYVGGVELCNGFGELTDAAEQRRRFVAEQERRRRTGAPVHPIDERFLDALQSGLPPSGGNALGLDRLVMLAVGAARIADVIAFPGETSLR